MKINIDGNVLLRNMMFWGEKTDDDCVEMATVEGKLDAEQALTLTLERDFCKGVIDNVISKLSEIKNS